MLQMTSGRTSGRLCVAETTISRRSGAVRVDLMGLLNNAQRPWIRREVKSRGCLLDMTLGEEGGGEGDCSGLRRAVATKANGAVGGAESTGIQALALGGKKGKLSIVLLAISAFSIIHAIHLDFLVVSAAVRVERRLENESISERTGTELMGRLENRKCRSEACMQGN